jgi:hypothetical protein
LRISSASSEISAAVGDSAIAAVSTKVVTETPTMSGSRKAAASAPFMDIGAPSGG